MCFDDHLPHLAAFSTILHLRGEKVKFLLYI